MKKRALITGIHGMDGSHLADLLLSLDYEVYGMERRVTTKDRENTRHLEGKVTFLRGDLSDQSSLFRCLKESDPDEVYNLGAQSFVGESWNTPEYTSKLVHPKCLAIRPMLNLGAIKLARILRFMRIHPFIQEVHMALQNYMDTGFVKTIVSHMECTIVPEFYSIMNQSEGVMNL